mmetsp:Transcript_15134/g.29750  ORF Transcript_15134/g.29750 Transcript_15134/m.29750 type:complete len:552 (-) Transcript_15134:273-1928(-)|eukprot:CAMPEP_0175104692 /NCGR_PEP_ID=MMETSP0086_2-20121207/9911_1 /TAXON_ID=136419 /ORGANISM="Unknown Unknown, Strain D1" /LENGTH=551 /DNA_ID=CAMNT_0016380197 /DNA_START=37 /DNA_END=1692 /DNA_ORIENTATION=+
MADDSEEVAVEVSTETAVAAPAKTEEVVLVNRTVIDEKLIQLAVVEDVETDEAGNPLKIENIELQEIKELTLSFQNIYAIDNLLGFEQLLQLKLDNNIIEKIDNLGHLVNLTWLDLSFNNIEKIENLDKLVNLTDLSLFSNKIKKIENLEKLVNLNVLSLGDNQISELSDIKDLRQFRKLRLLNLKGNPVCEDDEYKNTAYAYLTNLKYLDYALIDSADFQKARDSKLDQLGELEENEREEKKISDKKAAIDKRLDELADANLGSINGIVDFIFASDPETKKVKILPGYDNIVEQYNEKFTEILDRFTAEVMERHQTKEKEKELVLTVVDKVTRDNELKSIEIVQEFEAKRKRDFKLYNDSVQNGAPKPAILEDLKKEVSALSDKLMDLEMLLVEQMVDVLDEFQDTYMKFVVANVTRIGEAFKEMSEVAQWYGREMRDMVLALVERFSKDELRGEEDKPEVAALLSDKDVLLTVVSTSTDNHAAKVFAKEEQVVEQEDGKGKKLVADYRQQEYERNRHRVAEIHELVEKYISTIDQKLDFDRLNDEDDYE